jgi:hypothetical protein
MGLLGAQLNMSEGQSFKDNINYPQSVISRTKILEGRYVFSIINNGGSYFLIDLPVFEDGVINCWEDVDLDMVKEKIFSGWLTPSVPNMQKLSMHHLGAWEIEGSKWLYSKDSYFDFLLSVVKTMNPSLGNLFKANGTASKIIGNTNYSAFTYSTEQLVRKDSEENISFKEYKGRREHFFFKHSENRYWICSLNIYSDGKILIEGIDESKFIGLEELKNLVEQKSILTTIPNKSIVMIKDLGELVISKTLYSTAIDDKVSEIKDVIARLNGQQTTSDICYKLYTEYAKNPTDENKENLKTAYENVPGHLRIYVLGDMDSKDYPIREIIYGDE